MRGKGDLHRAEDREQRYLDDLHLLCNALKKVLLAAGMIVGRRRTCAEMAYRRRFESVSIKKDRAPRPAGACVSTPYGAAHGPSAVSDMRRRQACRSSGKYHEQNE